MSEKVSEKLVVNALDIEAQGVAPREDGKVVFIDGALPTDWEQPTVLVRSS